MPMTRRQAALARGDPAPADPPAPRRPRAVPRKSKPPNPASRSKSTTAVAANTDSDSEDEPVEEPKPKRQRREGPAKAVAAADPAPDARTNAGQSMLNGEDDVEPEPEPKPVPKKGKGKAKKSVADESIPDDWIPHAIDEIVPDHSAEAESSPQAAAAGVDNQAALLSQQHFSAAATPAAGASTRNVDGNGDGEDEQDDDATKWWRFFPDVLSRTPDDVRVGNQLDANANDSALLAAGVHDRTGFAHGFDPTARTNNNGGAAAPRARPMLNEDDGEDEEVPAVAPLVKPGLERDETQLFMSSEFMSLPFRLPMPPASIDMNSLECTDPSVLADVFARYVPVLRVRRPRIKDDGHFDYSWTMLTDDVYFVHPDSMTMTDDELNQLTYSSFADLEAADPYCERFKRVRPTPGREEHERLRSDGFVDAPRGIERKISDRLVFMLKGDTYWRHDGDWPEERDAGPLDSCAAGRMFIVWTGGANVSKWTADHNQYYRVVLRSVKDRYYPPPTPAEPDIYHEARRDKFQYHVVVYLRIDAANEALREDRDVPGFSDQLKYLTCTLEARSDATPPNFYVPDTIDSGHAPAPTPPGFQLQLHDYQQRTLGWLLALERSRRARTVCVHQATKSSTLQQREQFALTALRGLPNWIQLGPGGMWFNSASYEIAADPAVWADRIMGSAGIECRGALEVSKMGSGKTIMALSLVAANPFRSVREIVWDDPNDKLKYLVSRATLVVVRSDLVSQWVAEAQRALPPESKIVQVATIRDHRDLTWNDVLLADVVIVSLAFLQNNNYQKRVAKVVKSNNKYCMPREAYVLPCHDVDRNELKWYGRFQRQQWLKAPLASDMPYFNSQMDAHIACLQERTRARFGNDKDCVIFDRVYWHRIVIDEIHELSNVLSAREAWLHTSTRVAETLLFSLKTRFRLGLTGTPPLAHPLFVTALAEAVGVCGLPATVADAQAFLNTHVRRNEPDL
ncbi:hypothetical protein GGF31_003251, partial [Allomyces arbusculus]